VRRWSRAATSGNFVLRSPGTGCLATGGLAPRPQRGGRTTLRGLGLLVIVCSAALITMRVALARSLLEQPGAVLRVVEPLIALMLYAVVVFVATIRTAGRFQSLYRWVLRVGVITGVLWIANLAVETFAGLSGSLFIAASAPLLLGGVLAWTATGYAVARRTGSAAQGIAVSVGSAMLCALLTIVAGLALTFTSPGQLAHDLAGDPDFARSHWTDLRAFAFANTFSNAFSHLLEAPILAAATAWVASSLGAPRTQRSTADPHRPDPAALP